MRRVAVAVAVAVAAEIFGAAGAMALEVPESVRALLRGAGREALLERFAAIGQVTPSEFLRDFEARGPHAVAGTGFSSVVFRSRDRQWATKFAFALHAAAGLYAVDPRFSHTDETTFPTLAARWKRFFEIPWVRATETERFRDPERKASTRNVQHNLIAALVWAVHNPRPTPMARLLADDGMAYRMEHVEGPSLADVLRAERAGWPEGTLRYDMAKVWREVQLYERVNARMLADVGVATDLYNPGNFIVAGPAEEPRLVVIDATLVTPTAPVRNHYRTLGVEIPVTALAKELAEFSFATVPGQLLVNRLWELGFDQALAYVKAARGIDDEHDAVVALSETTIWRNEAVPFLTDVSNVEEAARRVRCPEHFH